MDSIIISHHTMPFPEYDEVFALRDEVLRKPLGMALKNDDLSRDKVDTFFVAKQDDQVIACLMLHHIDDDTLQLRQMAVYGQWQGKGVGRLLVQASEQYATRQGYAKMILHARKEAKGFYLSMNYTVDGAEFEEVGIPHYMMEKKLKSKNQK